METGAPKRIPIRGMLIGIVILLLVGLFGVPIFLANTVVGGVEFCPQLFQKRDFSYFRIPGTKIRLSSTSLSTAMSPSGTPVLTHLAASNPVEWHVAKASQGTNVIDYGPEILLGYLNMRNVDGANAWDDWSFKKPAHAKVLWPIVQEAAEKDLYFCVPELLQHASSENNPAILRRKLHLACVKAAQTKLKSLLNKQDLSLKTKLQSWALAVIEEYDGDTEFQLHKTELAPSEGSSKSNG